MRPVWRALAKLPDELYALQHPPVDAPASTSEGDELLLPDGSLRPFHGAYSLPNNRGGVVRAFGDCGATKLDRAWERENLVLARNLPLVPKGKLYLHHKIEDRTREALRRIELLCPEFEIEHIGCFCYRPCQHDPRMPKSFHSWGVALDVQPALNQLWHIGPVLDRRARVGPIGEPFDDTWYDYWPQGLPQRVVECFESCGFAWGGRWRTIKDPMHFQAVGGD